MYATDHTNVAWEGATCFFHNTAGYLGGTISVFHGSNVSWRGEITLDTNFAGLYGGGVSLVSGLYFHGVEKHGSMMTWLALMGVPWLITTTPTLSVAGIRHIMPEIEVQGYFGAR